MSAAAPFTVLVMAKAPVPGRVKTRLAATVGDDEAAELATAALLDTVAAVDATPGATGLVSLDGDLGAGPGAERLRAALAGWRCVPQRGPDFATRLVRAHDDAGRGPVVQIGMDTPQVSPQDLRDAVADLVGADAVLGPASDGGWWALARLDPAVARPLRQVEMSTPSTGIDTRRAIEAADHRVTLTRTLQDVDTPDDADTVAADHPDLRFSRRWHDRRESR